MEGTASRMRGESGRRCSWRTQKGHCLLGVSCKKLIKNHLKYLQSCYRLRLKGFLKYWQLHGNAVL